MGQLRRISGSHGPKKKLTFKGKLMSNTGIDSITNIPIKLSIW